MAEPTDRPSGAPASILRSCYLTALRVIDGQSVSRCEIHDQLEGGSAALPEAHAHADMINTYLKRHRHPGRVIGVWREVGVADTQTLVETDDAFVQLALGMLTAPAALHHGAHRVVAHRCVDGQHVKVETHRHMLPHPYARVERHLSRVPRKEPPRDLGPSDKHLLGRIRQACGGTRQTGIRLPCVGRRLVLPRLTDEMIALKSQLLGSGAGIAERIPRGGR